MRSRHLLTAIRSALRGERASNFVFSVDAPSISGEANIHERARVMLNGRAGAEQAVEQAITQAENDAPTEAQVDDLSEAVDSLGDRTYQDAVEFAEKGSEKLRASPQNHGDRLKRLRSKFTKLLRRPFPKEM